MRRAGIVVVLALLAAGCSQPASDARARNPEQYDRDHAQCAAQVEHDTRSRRMVDQSRRDVFRDDRDRYGQGALPEQMDAYSDTKSTDRLVAACMEGRGWSQPRQEWWQRVGPFRFD